MGEGVHFFVCQFNSQTKLSRKENINKCTSAILISASVYCKPFWMMFNKAAGGTKAPLMFDWLMWLSIPKVYAECTNPEKKDKVR